MLGCRWQQPISRFDVRSRVAVFRRVDALSINGTDLRDLPLHERKRRLARIMPWVESADAARTHRASRCRLFELACERGLEGIVNKNPDYTQAEGRHELFSAAP